MADHKKHHYVPRFYLKFFSENEKGINLFNIASQRTVHNGNLKNQCYRNYFYGKDQVVEDSLALTERAMSTVLRSVIQNNALHVAYRQHKLFILQYIILQHTRTAYAIDAFDEQTDAFMKHLLSPQIQELNLISEQINGIKITNTESARLALGIAAPHYPLLIDLKCKLLVATGQHEFITSDNPVVFYNQLMSFQRQRPATGFVAKGLQIFFPISPKHLILLYDGNVYGVGSKQSHVIHITEHRDIEQLNRLQFVSALENIYFLNDRYSAISDYSQAAKFRRTAKINMRVYPQEETVEHRREFVFLAKEEIRTNLALSFIRLIKPAKAWLKEFQKMTSQPAVVVRNKQIIRDFEEFMERVDAQHYGHNDFFTFIHDKYQTTLALDALATD